MRHVESHDLQTKKIKKRVTLNYFKKLMVLFSFFFFNKKSSLFIYLSHTCNSQNQNTQRVPHQRQPPSWKHYITFLVAYLQIKVLYLFFNQFIACPFGCYWCRQHHDICGRFCSEGKRRLFFNLG